MSSQDPPRSTSTLPAWLSAIGSGAVGIAAGASLDMDGERIMEWVERLGGWGVVILVVRWLLSRTDRLIALVNALVAENADSHARLVRISEGATRRIEDIERCQATCPLRAPDCPLPLTRPEPPDDQAPELPATS